LNSKMNPHLFLDEVLTLWAELVGFDPTRRFGNYQIDGMTEELHQARDLDPSGVTCYMLLKAYVRAWASTQNVTALDLLDGLSEQDLKIMDSLRGLYSKLLGCKELQTEEILYKDLVRQAIHTYEVSEEVLGPWLQNDHEMALLRRDALLSMRKLSAHQFCKGTPSTENPKCNLIVYEMWNMPSLVRVLVQQRLPGISVVLLRDEAHLTSSFFCFAISNGENVVVLTDRETLPHPEAKFMRRCPGRDLDRRVAQHHFPYEILTEGSVDSRGDSYVPSRSSLVRIQSQAIPRLEFKDLQPNTAIWLTLMFELIRQEYFLSGKTLPDLSYTIEMVRNPQVLFPTDHSLVVRGLYQPLEIPSRTIADVQSDAPTLTSQWRRETLGHHQWMLDRYASQVPTEALNLLGQEDVKLLLGTPSSKVESWEIPNYQGTGNTEAVRALTEISVGKGFHNLMPVDPVSFGTKEEILRDVDWTARRNLCVVVQRLADREFEATVGDVYARYTSGGRQGWFVDKLQERKSWLVDMAVCGSFKAPAQRIRNSEEETFAVTTKPEEVDILQVRQMKHWDEAPLSFWPGFVLPAPSSQSGRCCMSDGAASYFVKFQPQDSRSISLLLGVPESQLPWQFQHWILDDNIYVGNSILERLDPAEWLLANPWAQHNHGAQRLGLSFGFCLGKRFVNKRRKELGLPPILWSSNTAS
jgi:hypothetical protein